MHTRDYSDETARVIDEEVERILRDEENRTRKHAHRAPRRARGGGARRCSSARRSTAPRSPAWSTTRWATRRRAPHGRCAPTAPRRSSRPPATATPSPTTSSSPRTVVAWLARETACTPGARSEGAEVGFGGAAGVAQLGHRGPEVGGGERADERPPHDAVGVGDERSSGSPRARSGGAARRGARRRSRTSRRRRDSSGASFVGEALARVARRRREQRDQPRRPRDAGSRRGRAGAAPGRRRAAAARAGGGGGTSATTPTASRISDRDHERGTTIRASAPVERDRGCAVLIASHRRRRASVSPTTTGWSAVTTSDAGRVDAEHARRST